MSLVKDHSPLKRWIYSREEKRNIIIYIFGIVLYKFGLEAFNGSIITLATNRFDQDALKSGRVAHTFEKVGYVAGLNQALQCVGSILIAPLIKHFPSRTILSIGIFLFGLCTAILIILDVATGGHIKPKDFNSTNRNDFSYYGKYKSDWIIIIYGITGIAYGIVESIHRVIPRDIVGYNEQKLQTLDALIHIFYATSGAIGAFLTGLVLIPNLGNNQAFLITPILFTASGITWLFLSLIKKKKTKQRNINNQSNEQKSKGNFIKILFRKIIGFGESIFIGGKIIFSNRKYMWLFTCYSLTFYAHRYLEDGIAPQIARRYLSNVAWSEILVGGSNFGELLGSIFGLFFINSFRTPLPWLRFSALLLFIVWYIPFIYPPANTIKYAWIIALTFVPISFGWAASDIAIVAHIQSSMTKLEAKYEHVSVLGAVMSFLYSSYIIFYAIANPFLGKYIDNVYKRRQTIRPALFYTVALQFTLIAIIVIASTFIPKGSCSFDPQIEEEDDDDQQEDEDLSDTPANTDPLIDKNHQLTESINT